MAMNYLHISASTRDAAGIQSATVVCAQTRRSATMISGRPSANATTSATTIH